jgi:hypothetical protein
MKLKELRDVLRHTELPILLCTNRLRWGQCTSEREAVETRLQLADFVTIKADLQEHIFELGQILEICDAVTRGRYLEDRQRCHWKDHTCQYACTTKDEHCDSFDDQPPHQAILGWLEECRPLRDAVKDWIVAQGELQQKMRQGFRRFFPDVKAYRMGEDKDGNQVMAEMTREDQVAYDTKQTRQHESVASRVEQYELNLERIRVICRQGGSLHEVAAMIAEGL